MTVCRELPSDAIRNLVLMVGALKLDSKIDELLHVSKGVVPGYVYVVLVQNLVGC